MEEREPETRASLREGALEGRREGGSLEGVSREGERERGGVREREGGEGGG